MYWNGYQWKSIDQLKGEELDERAALVGVERGDPVDHSGDAERPSPLSQDLLADARAQTLLGGGFVCTTDSISETPEPSDHPDDHLSFACPAECGHTWREPDRDDIIVTPDHNYAEIMCPGSGEPAVVL